MKLRLATTAATWLFVMSASAQPLPDANGRIVTCRFKKLPEMKVNMTGGRETLMVGDRSFTVSKGSGFWSASPYLLAFNGETADRKGLKVWAQNEKTGIEENAVCRSAQRSR